ncbi:MAG: YggT family protein [Parachlamydiales bacterium]|nr:YggT family protein [Parachlamydiales bacterium]
MLAFLFRIAFTVYSIMILARIFGSWFPSFHQTKTFQFVAMCTDPYLDLFRRFIPTLGSIDLSPIVALFALQIVEKLLIKLVSH